MLLIPVIVFLVLIGLIVSIAYTIKQKYGYKKQMLLAGHIFLLLPWLMHYAAFLKMTDSDSLPARVFAVPVILLLLAMIAARLNSAIPRAVNILIPSLAFISTYYFVMPTVYEAVPNYKFDNIPTIWLFFWTIGATSTLVAYTLPGIANKTQAREHSM